MDRSWVHRMQYVACSPVFAVDHAITLLTSFPLHSCSSVIAVDHALMLYTPTCMLYGKSTLDRTRRRMCITAVILSWHFLP